MRNCSKCHEKLSKKEERKQEQENEEVFNPVFMCDDCIFHEENQDHSFEYEQHSDADMGL